MAIIKYQKNSGFTLVETLFMAGIMALAVLSMLVPYILSQQLLVYSKHRIQATNMCLAQMETVKNTSYDSLATGTAVESSLTMDPGTAATGDEILATRTTVVTQNPSEDIKTINVTVGWSNNILGRAVTGSETMTSYLTRR